MDTLFVFVTLVVVVTARHIPDTDYVPPLEQLALIFGPSAQIQDNASAVETPALVPKGSVNTEKTIKPYQKRINEVYNSVTPETEELNSKIKDDKNVKQNPVKGNPDIHTRFVEDMSLTDDRVALGVNDCPSDKVRFNDKCVTPDT